jgi:hypothetical protein
VVPAEKCYQIALDRVATPVRRGQSGAALRRRRRLWYGHRMPSYPFHVYGTRDRKTAFGVTDFLRGSDKLAAMLPAAMRAGNLQKDVRLILPPMYAHCEVLSLQEGTLSLAVPSSAVAAKLKQQVPKLQTSLQKKGWSVDAVRIKIQVGRALPAQDQQKRSSLVMPATAVTAFEELGNALPDSKQNAALIAAIRRLAEKRKNNR